jgi:hypothetical protein
MYIIMTVDALCVISEKENNYYKVSILQVQSQLVCIQMFLHFTYKTKYQINLLLLSWKNIH